jgi:hypothetical protein
MNAVAFCSVLSLAIARVVRPRYHRLGLLYARRVYVSRTTAYARTVLPSDSFPTLLSEAPAASRVTMRWRTLLFPTPLLRASK